MSAINFSVFLKGTPTSHLISDGRRGDINPGAKAFKRTLNALVNMAINVSSLFVPKRTLKRR